MSIEDEVSARHTISSVFLIGLCSGVLYLVVYFAQRSLFRNGLLLPFAGVTTQGDPASWLRLLGQCAAYYGATIAIFALYIRLLTLCRRGHLRDLRACAVALLFPALFNLGLLLGQPYLSIDLFSYIAYGSLGSAPGGNPYIEPVSSVGFSPLGAHLVMSGWRPLDVVPLTPYGPLWVRLETAILRITSDVPTDVLLSKGLAVAASLGSAALIWAILGRVRPADQLLGTLLYLWNPVVIVEFAAEGHNDALVILCVLAAIFLTVAARPALALVMLLLAVLTKYVPLILLPAQAVYFWSAWRTRPERARLASLLLLGLLGGLMLAVVLYRPFWVGMATFQGVREQDATRIGSASTAGIVYWFIAHSPLRAVAEMLTSALLDSIFVAYLLIVSWRARCRGLAPGLCRYRCGVCASGVAGLLALVRHATSRASGARSTWSLPADGTRAVLWRTAGGAAGCHGPPGIYSVPVEPRHHGRSRCRAPASRLPVACHQRIASAGWIVDGSERGIAPLT